MANLVREMSVLWMKRWLLTDKKACLPSLTFKLRAVGY